MTSEAKDKTLREIIVQSYRVMYRLEPDKVLAVMHGSQDVGGMAAKPWDES